MTTEKQIGTLEEMTIDCFTNRPKESPNAIEEYLFNLTNESADKARDLEKRLDGDTKYYEQFKLAITHTSLMIVLMSLKASSLAELAMNSGNAQFVLDEIQIDYDKYVREFLMYARQDDKDIYDMRMFYITELTSENLELTVVNREAYESATEFDAAVKKASILAVKYDELRTALRTQYMESKIHLQ